MSHDVVSHLELSCIIYMVFNMLILICIACFFCFDTLENLTNVRKREQLFSPHDVSESCHQSTLFGNQTPLMMNLSISPQTVKIQQVRLSPDCRKTKKIKNKQEHKHWVLHDHRLQQYLAKTRVITQTQCTV